jgi:hypothetical protein
MQCSLSKTTDETSTLVSEELGISLSSLNVIVSDLFTVEPESKRSLQQNIG